MLEPLSLLSNNDQRIKRPPTQHLERRERQIEGSPFQVQIKILDARENGSMHSYE